MKNLSKFLSIIVLSYLALQSSLAQAANDEIASYSVETEVKLVSDLRNRGISDSALRPGALITVQAAHESGLIGLVQLSTVSKRSYLSGNGSLATIAAGWRSGDPEGLNYGVGLANEFFPGSKFEAPHRFDLSTGTPTDIRTTKYNSAYAVFELGYGDIKGRALNVISKNYRGINTGSVCGILLQIRSDPTSGLDCYSRGDQNSRSSWLLDLDYRYQLTPNTVLNFHIGHQLVKNFKEANLTDYSISITTKQWDFQWTAEALSTRTKARELFLVADGSQLKRIDNSRLVLSVARKF